MSLRVPGTAVARDDQDLYDGVARDVAASVVRAYSTSFGLACRLLGQPVRDHVRNVYAMVRLADEIVDGPMGVRYPERAGAVLNRLEIDVADAVDTGYSSNLVLHAFAATARACGIGDDLVTPFFASMRADLTECEHDEASFARYVYGSAEVVGLMCLKVFRADRAVGGSDPDELADGARRLGAAFQKINFLRDLADDYRVRGRRYFPGVDPERLTDAEKDRLLDDIDADLDAAARTVRWLPDSSRSAVAVAHAVFTELSKRLRATPADDLLRRRVRVSAPIKIWLTARTCLKVRGR
jgi:phytoene/squalene synthetase